MPTAARPYRGELVGELFDVLRDLPLLLSAPLYRRWHMWWGATDVEINEPLPGDQELPRAQYRSTRAITISASVLVPALQTVEVGQWVPMSPATTSTERTALKVHSFATNEWLLWTKLLMAFGDFAMLRRMLRGIKQRAEALHRTPDIGNGIARIASPA